jgi:hypothetical protein
MNSLRRAGDGTGWWGSAATLGISKTDRYRKLTTAEANSWIANSHHNHEEGIKGQLISESQ